MKQQISYQATAFYHLSKQPNGEESELWVIFHGYGQLAEFFLRKFQDFFSEDRLFIAPEGTNYNYLQGFHGRVGANWMTKYERETAIENNHRYLNALLDSQLESFTTEPKLKILGFSQGAATASRWASQIGYPVDKLILWGGGFAHDLKWDGFEEKFQQTRLYVVLGNQDEFITPESIKKQEELIRVINIEVEKVTYSGGHDLHYPTLKKLID
ncbi:alpha/beta hydrolase [Belliella pelovolcani]|uniref:Predicted esterase n=1 Tax=Belliella pelovolcani TaxID=529505 RepID=A0A1N7JHL9_9BACT|nr:alpha/beta hydrolase [Belliella pelovolcani]SIS48810.1 Predicted esterase [Belliella pelovolcani]